jgi:hypothetical protein
MSLRLVLLVVPALMIPTGAVHSVQPFEVPPGQATYEYLCGFWIPEEPRTNWILVDVCMCGFDGGRDFTGPTEAQREVIRELGGKLLYEFNVPFIRARMPVAAMGSLDYFCWVQSVSHPRRYPVEMFIGLNGPLSAADRAFLESLGVVIVREPPHGRSVLAIIPDASIPAVRTQGGFRYVEPNGRVCPLRGNGEVTASRSWDKSVPSQIPTPGEAQYATWGRLKAHCR